MAKQKHRTFAKRSLAVISSIAVLLSCGMTGLFTAEAAETTYSASADGDILGPTKTSHLYDTYGNRLTDTDDDTPIVYVDNSTAAGGSTTAEVVFEIQNTASDPELDDSMVLSDPVDKFGVSVINQETSAHKKRYTVRIEGTYVGDKVQYTDPFTQKDASYYPILPYPAGKYDLTLQTKSGEGFRKLSVVVQSPATDMTIFYRSSAALEINKYDMYNTAPGLLAVANHQYRLSTKIETTSPNAGAEYLDTVEWLLYDGEFSGDMLYDDPNGTSTNKGMIRLDKLEEIYANPPATRAEITQDGLLTAKSNGPVTLVARFKDTIKAQKDYERRLRAYNREGDFSLPEPQYISDRNPVAGIIRRKVFVPDLDENKNIKWENGEIVYKVDNEGNRYTADYNKDYRIRREHYKLNGDGVEYGRPIMLDKNTPELVPAYTTPKFITIYIAKDNPATAIDFTKTPENNTMIVNDTFPLEITPTPTHNANEPGYESGATDEFEWESNNPNVVEVDNTGLLTAKGKGKAIITVIGDNVSAAITIEVRSPAESVAIDPRTASTRVGVPITLTAIMSPKDANEDIIWTSDKPGVATVTGDVPADNSSNIRTATVTGVTVGTATITAKTKNSGVEIKCLVTVNKANLSDNITLTTDIGDGLFEINNNDVIDLYTNQDIVIESALKTDDGSSADDETVWTVDDPSSNTTFEVKKNKLYMHGASEGTINIKAESVSNPNINKVFKVRVLRCCDSVAVVRADNGDRIGKKSMHVGSTFEIDADMRINDDRRPYEHSDSIKSFVCADPSIAEVENITDSIGTITGCKITALKNGNTRVTVTTGSGKTASMDVYVYTASSISISNIKLGDDNTLSDVIKLNNELQGTKKIEAAVRDQNLNIVGDATLIWSSSDPNVATVSDDGLVTAHDVGTTVISVRTDANTAAVKQDECTITVYAPVSAAETPTINPLIYTPSVTSYEPNPSFVVGEHTLVKDFDYTIEYSRNTGVGNAMLKITGTGFYYGEKSVDFKIEPRPVTDNTIVVDYIEDQECTGRAIEPEPNVTCQGYKLVNGKDYRCRFENNVKPGTASVIIDGMGNYTGTLTRTFAIVCHHNELRNVNVLKRPTYEEDGLEVGDCVACGETNVQKVLPKFQHTGNTATSIYFMEDDYGISQGEAMQLDLVAVTSDPSVAATDAFRWESSDPGIVSVDDTGLIKGNNRGRVTITVYGENEGVEATCTVAVLRKIEEIKAEPDPVNTRVGVAVEAKVTITPMESDDELLWSVDNANIATVTPSETDKFSAIVTGVSVGETKLTVKGRFSGVSQTVTVNVGERFGSDIIAISTMVGDTPVLIPNSTETTEYTYKVFTNQDIVFDAAISDDTGNASDDTVVWHISDNDGNFVTLPDNDPDQDVVANSIKIHAASLGTVTVTVWPQNDPDLKTHFKLEVAKRCDSVVIKDDKERNFNGISLNVSDTIQLHADLTIVDPINMYNHGDAVRDWSSSDPDTVSIDQSGFVMAKKNGNATITVTTLSGRTASANITVFTTSNVYLINGVTKPENEGDLPYTKIALNNELVGTAKIEAAIYNQNEERVGNAYGKWSSSNENVATVDETGLVSGHKVGTAIITVKSGAKSQQCTVTVTAPVTAFTYDDIQPMIYDPTKTSYEPDPVLSAGNNIVLKNIDYTVEYQDNTRVGTGRMIVTGMGNYTDVMTITFQIARRSLNDPAVKFTTIPDQNYTGSAIEPAVTVTCNGVTLDPEVDYAVEYRDNVQPGKATINIIARNGSNYSDSKAIEFNIVNNASGIMGDLDGDGAVTSADALIVLRNSVGLTDFNDNEKILADVNRDQAVDSGDSIAILRFSVFGEDPSGIINTKA